jgi:hypothetical protein
MRFQAWLTVGALVALAQSGCGSNTCSGTYNCPAILFGAVDFPANLPASVAQVTAAAPCTASYPVGDMENSVLVSFNGSINAGATATCQVQARLSNGLELVASVSFQSRPCCGNTAVGGPSTFASADAGALDSADAD